MKPCSCKPTHSSSYINIDFNTTTSTTIRAIKGNTTKLSLMYANAYVAIFSEANLLPIGVTKADASGNYAFYGVPKGFQCFIVGFDISRQYNHVIQGRVTV